MADALLLQHTSVCAEWGPVHYASINHQCVPSDDWYATCASVIVGVTPDTLLLHVNSVCRVMTGKLLHQISLCAELWVTECYCIRYRCVRSDDWYIITASVITVRGVMPGALLLHSSMCSERWLMQCYCIRHYLYGVMTGTVLLHQSAMCADGETMLCYCIRHQCVGWGPVHCSSISYQCVPFDDWLTITASVINVCGVMTGALFLHQSSLSVEQRQVLH